MNECDKTLLRTKKPRSDEYDIAMDAIRSSERFTSCSFVHVYPNCNEVAHGVAKYALGVE